MERHIFIRIEEYIDMNRKYTADSLKGVTIQQYKTDIGFRTLVESVDENLYIIRP